MKALVLGAARSRWLFAVCVALYLGFLGPQLISAASTLAVLAGAILFGLLLAWGYRLLRRHSIEKE